MDAWLSDKKIIQRSKRYYAHFDVRTDIGRMKDYASNPKAVAAHGFYPFIHYEMDMSKFKRGKGVVLKNVIFAMQHILIGAFISITVTF